MSLPIAPDLWQQLCQVQAQFPSCIVTLYKHGGVIGKAEVLLTLKAGQCDEQRRAPVVQGEGREGWHEH